MNNALTITANTTTLSPSQTPSTSSTAQNPRSIIAAAPDTIAAAPDTIVAAPDTIVACATPVGRGGISIVRISGSTPAVARIAGAILSTHARPPPRYATRCDFLSVGGSGAGCTGAPIDNGIALYFPAPHSFTGEDVLELQGHGGSIVTDLLIARVLELGARLARPGEFSERAFLNGKIDLTQAEAIADLIDAASEQAATYAMRSLQGEFSHRLHALSDRITHLRANVEAALDFADADEDISFTADDALQQQLAAIIDDVRTTHRAAQQGVLLHEGLSVVITGKPNAGKSSLLNCLSGEDTAIVTPIPGTTRDVLRTHVKLDGGLVLQLVDTAGLRRLDGVDRRNDAVVTKNVTAATQKSTATATGDPNSITSGDADANLIEREGIRRARAEIAKAQYILLVVDCASDGVKTPQQLWQEYQEYFADDANGESKNEKIASKNDDAKNIKGVNEVNTSKCNPNFIGIKNLIVVYNKIDLATGKNANPNDSTSLSIPATPQVIMMDNTPCIFIAARQKLGIELVKKILQDKAGVGEVSEGGSGGFSARRRHLIALTRATTHLIAAQNLVDKDATAAPAALELIAEELREAQQNFGEITGEVTTDDLLDIIFSEFCVGK